MAVAFSDLDLLSAWRRGDPVAGETLFERHYAKISRFFFNKAREEDAADLIQKTFLRCVERHTTKGSDTEFGAFLFGIARNVLLEYYRGKHRQHGPLEFAAASLEALDPTPSSVLGHRREARILLQALRRIPIEMQVVLELYMFEGLQGREISQIVGAPLPTVRTWIRRSKQLLQTQVDRLTRNPALRESTMTDLDQWIEEIRVQVADKTR